MEVQIKKGDIIYHQYLTGVPLEVINSNICQTLVKNVETKEELLIDNEYILTKGNYNKEMRQTTFSSILDENLKQKIKEEDEN